MPIIQEDAMRNYNPSNLAFKTLKGEVSDAMHFDWKRDKIDDAKKRAIYTATSYDDFTARVKGCTLKPIHKNEFNAPPKYVFNRQGQSAGEVPAYVKSTASSSSAAPAAAPAAGRAATAGAVAAAGALPRNARELDRELRKRQNAEEKAGLFALLDGEAIARLFPRELDAELFRTMLEVLQEAGAPGEGRRLLRELALRCPTQTAKASAFLTPQERGIAARLLARDVLQDGSDEDVLICAALGVPPAAVAAAASVLREAVATTAGGSASEARPDDMRETAEEAPALSAEPAPAVVAAVAEDIASVGRADAAQAQPGPSDAETVADIGASACAAAAPAPGGGGGAGGAFSCDGLD